MIQFLLQLFLKDVDPDSKEGHTAYGDFAGRVGICCNVLLFLGKMIAGYWSGSTAIVADAVNNLSDASSNIVSMVGFKLASKPADKEHPYGHARYEYLAGLFVSVMILVIGVELLKEGIGKILHPARLVFHWVGIVILLFSIAVKLWMCLFNRRMGAAIHSQTLLATAADARNDVISTAAVLLSTLLCALPGMSGRVDGITGTLVALFILYSGVGIIRSSLDPLLGAAPDAELVAYIEKKALGYPGVLGVHDLLIHDYGPGNRLVTMHLEMAAEADVLQSHEVIDALERDLLAEDGLEATIHFDPISTQQKNENTVLREFLRRTAKELEPQAYVHDVSLHPQGEKTKVCFDCLIPASYFAANGRQADSFGKDLQHRAQERWHNCLFEVRLEPDYAPIHEEKTQTAQEEA